MSTNGRVSPWLSLAGLVLLVAAAGAGSSLSSAPTRRVSPSTTTSSSPPESCPAPPGAASITLSYVSPSPSVTISVEALLVVNVPAWHFGSATDVRIAQADELKEECSTLLPDRGRRTVLMAESTGTTELFATITPPTDAMMPAWIGYVVVTPGSGPSS